MEGGNKPHCCLSQIKGGVLSLATYTRGTNSLSDLGHTARWQKSITPKTPTSSCGQMAPPPHTSVSYLEPAELCPPRPLLSSRCPAVTSGTPLVQPPKYLYIQTLSGFSLRVIGPGGSGEERDEGFTSWLRLSCSLAGSPPPLQNIHFLSKFTP